MSSPREQMQAAKHLIQTKQYRKARRILKKVDHVKADEWLRKLDTIAPESKRPSVWVILGYVMFTLAGCALVVFVLGWAYTTTDNYQAQMGSIPLMLYCNHAYSDDPAACLAHIDTLDVVVVADCNRNTNVDDLFDEAYAMALCVERATGVEF